MAERIFIAGASGVVGRPLCRLLVADGHAVVGSTRTPARVGDLRALGVEPVVVDVYDRDALVDVVSAARPAVVVHQLTDLPDRLEPSEMPAALLRNDRIRDVGTRNLIAAALAAGAGRLVVQSIAFRYAPGPMPYREDAPLNSPSLAAFERQVLDAPLAGLILRYGKFYGPDTGADRPPPGGPVHVDAAADAARRAVARGTPGVYNIAEDDGAVSIAHARLELGWDPAFRLKSSS